MDNYRKPPRVNRYWKRPKPKVYDCNIRDAERFYQESYKHYLAEKEEAAARAARARSFDSAGHTEFYPHLLAGSTARRDTSARQEINLPPLPPSLTEATRARLEAELSVAHAGAMEPTKSIIASSVNLPAFDPISENATLEERLARLKKLRENLGLPAEPDTGGATQSLRSESIGRSAGGGGAALGTDIDSYKSERTMRSKIDTGPEETTSYRSERTTRSRFDTGPEETTSYKSERATRSRFDTGPEETTSYKTERTTRSRFDAGPEETSTYRSERTARSRLDAGPEESNYSLRSERSARMNGTVGPGEDYNFRSDAISNGYRYRSERRNTEDSLNDDVSDRSYRYKSDLKADDFKVGGRRSVDYDMPVRSERTQRNLSPPKLDRKRDDYSFSSSSAEKSNRYSSAVSTSSSAGVSRKTEQTTKESGEAEVDDDKLASMMKKLPSSQEILERISKLELDD